MEREKKRLQRKRERDEDKKEAMSTKLGSELLFPRLDLEYHCRKGILLSSSGWDGADRPCYSHQAKNSSHRNETCRKQHKICNIV